MSVSGHGFGLTNIVFCIPIPIDVSLSHSTLLCRSPLLVIVALIFEAQKKKYKFTCGRCDDNTRCAVFDCGGRTFLLLLELSDIDFYVTALHVCVCLLLLTVIRVPSCIISIHVLVRVCEREKEYDT